MEESWGILVDTNHLVDRLSERHGTMVRGSWEEAINMIRRGGRKEKEGGEKGG